MSIYASSFSRARETAQILHDELAAAGGGGAFVVGGVAATRDLVERYFGDFDKTSNANYENIWRHDPVRHLRTTHTLSLRHTHAHALHTHSTVPISRGSTLSTIASIHNRAE